jgi:hypothetical protein
MGVWKRRSVFWDLPYWKILGMPHCLDVMHITKNVCESLLGTLFNMPDRTKDGPNARNGLMAINIRKELHLPPAEEISKGKSCSLAPLLLHYKSQRARPDVQVPPGSQISLRLGRAHKQIPRPKQKNLQRDEIS